MPGRDRGRKKDNFSFMIDDDPPIKCHGSVCRIDIERSKTQTHTQWLCVSFIPMDYHKAHHTRTCIDWQKWALQLRNQGDHMVDKMLLSITINNVGCDRWSEAARFSRHAFVIKQIVAVMSCMALMNSAFLTHWVRKNQDILCLQHWDKLKLQLMLRWG